jgi:segregation and condensation protein B
MELISIVEALLFASQEPLGVPQMCAAVKETAKDILEAAAEPLEEGASRIPEWVAPLAETTEEQVRGIIDDLIARYDAEKHAFTLVERANGWRIAARGEYAEWCRALYPGKKVQRLSQPALETLAIVAYRQPITKAGIEAVRGVSVDAMVQQLIDRGLMKIEGRADLPAVLAERDQQAGCAHAREEDDHHVAPTPTVAELARQERTRAEHEGRTERVGREFLPIRPPHARDHAHRVEEDREDPVVDRMAEIDQERGRAAELHWASPCRRI